MYVVVCTSMRLENVAHNKLKEPADAYARVHGVLCDPIKPKEPAPAFEHIPCAFYSWAELAHEEHVHGPPAAALEAGAASRGLGAADFLTISKAFSVVFVSDIPLLNAERLNQMRRFTTFVDCVYGRGVRLHCLAPERPERLYQVDVNMKSNVDEVFAFDRTVSRLTEMGSEAYLLAHSERREEFHGQCRAHLFLAPGTEGTAKDPVENEEECEEYEEPRAASAGK
ncbi:hypothetical protein KRP22_014179 [Phytophthora ramorum]|nr:AFG1-like ATPase [Phytophthora ramorum]